MTLTPKARAHIASAVAMLPYMVGAIFFRELLTTHAWVYVAILSCLASFLVYLWVHTRAAALLPLAPTPAPELALTEEPFPHAAWLAIIPPLLVVAELWWVTQHGDALPWRHAPPGKFRDGSSYRILMGGMIFWNSFAAWMTLFGVAVWHGMSRAYQFRRAQLLAGVTNQWAVFVLVNGSLIGTAFDVPESDHWVLFIPILAGIAVMIWNSRRLHKLYSTLPRLGTWFYRDANDPTFFGPSGVNLASGWSWVLIGSVIPPTLIIEWLLR